ncbi:MAG: energy-coupling factor transporter transmembrane protein EcfT [Treponema sp.]|jgi:energy-coupling factor transporter transmembrane protein EcfT|nr:energy-coupling factor transporter transmembrane protein EcfT [Treponema sp.]
MMSNPGTRKNKMEKTILGYVPLQSPVYALHPTVRLALYLLTGILPMFIQTPEFTIAFLIFALTMFPVANINIGRLKMFTPMFISVFVFIMLVHLLAPINKDEHLIVFSAGFVQGHFHSLMWGFCIYLRMISLVIASIFYFSTNRERDFLVALRVWKLPFAISYFCGLSMRSAGIFMEDYTIIREAEKARGLDTRNLTLTGKIKHFCMYLVPLFTLSIRRSEEISMALYAKGLEYTGRIEGHKRADWLRSKMTLTVKDKVLVVIILGVFVVGMVFAFGTGFFSLVNSPIYKFLKYRLFGL